VDLYIHWILSQGKERWGRQLYVYNLRQEREWARRMLRGTPEFQAMNQAWNSAYGSNWNPADEAIRSAEQVIADVSGLLRTEDYREISGWFDVRHEKLGYDPDWYKPGPNAPRSLYALATKLDRKVEYTVLYKSFSDHAHGSRTNTAFRVRGEGLVGIQPVRALLDFPFVFSITASLIIRAYGRLLDEYRPAEQRQFSETIVQKWRERLTPPAVVEQEQMEIY
jgi:hypothetical protein